MAFERRRVAFERHAAGPMRLATCAPVLLTLLTCMRVRGSAVSGGDRTQSLHGTPRALGRLRSASRVQKIRRNLVDEEFVKEHFLEKENNLGGNTLAFDTRAKSLANKLLMGEFWHSKLLSDPPSKRLIAELLMLGVEESDIQAIEEWRGRKGNGQAHRRTSWHAHGPKRVHADVHTTTHTRTYAHAHTHMHTRKRTFPHPARACRTGGHGGKAWCSPKPRALPSSPPTSSPTPSRVTRSLSRETPSP